MKFIKQMRKKSFIFFTISFLIIIASSIGVVLWLRPEPVHSPTAIKAIKNNVITITLSTLPKVSQIPTKPSGFSLTNPASMWIIVNKQHPLAPISYIPDDLVATDGATIRSIAESDFESLMTDSAAAGVNLTIVSSYRSYYTQANLYNNYVSTYGQAATDTFSARAGYSEHQTGLAIDFGSNTNVSCSLDSCFGETTEGKWLLNHAYEYGFILRYPSDKQTITGYKSEPWHYRYVGHDLATQMKNKFISTLEEFFNISGGEIYK